MAVPIKMFENGFVQECTVILTKAAELSGGRCDVNFVIKLDDEVIAEGYCYIPTDGEDNWSGVAIRRNVRFKAAQNLLGDASICATDMAFGAGWLSEMPFNKHNGETLHAHGRGLGNRD